MKMPIAIAGCCVAGLCLSNLTHAQQTSQEFQLAFCNISNFSRVLVAIAHRQDAQRWTVDGWYPVADYGCSIAGTFKGDTVYYYAFGETRDGRNVTWSRAGQRQDGVLAMRGPRQVLPHHGRPAGLRGRTRTGTVQDDQGRPEPVPDHLEPVGWLRTKPSASATSLFHRRLVDRLSFSSLAGPRRERNHALRFGRHG